MRWLEENETDVRVRPDWLFDYASLFKPFNVYLENVTGSCSHTSEIVEDEEEYVVYIPPLVTSVSPLVGEAVQSTSSSTPSQRISFDAEVTSLTPKEREIITRDSSADTPLLM